ncbi:hypothetical protein SCUCBS95973_007028 [Sporothrix curviconia]|uniref:Uncharacterized protein n=1 Tax=Sporothrix curviconia TaxID=1260050 RepID=A0ABP0CB65_9PEZI
MPKVAMGAKSKEDKDDKDCKDCKDDEDDNDDKGGFLPSDVEYSSASAVLDKAYSDADAGRGQVDCLIVGHVSAARFRAIEIKRDRRNLRCRLFFLPDHGCAIITVPGGPHEQTHMQLYDLVRFQFYAMGINTEWKSTGATTFTAPGGGGSGEGDSGAGPRGGNTHNGRRWPTLVIETGVSQSMASLRAKGRWWFAASGYHMKVVVLAKVVVGQSMITMEKWTAGHSQTNRPGATMTRAATRAGLVALEPVRRQQIDITWSGPRPVLETPAADRTAGLFTVVGAPLVLGFEELMLRAPVVAVGEHDIIITEANLQELASLVWEEFE